MALYINQNAVGYRTYFSCTWQDRSCRLAARVNSGSKYTGSVTAFNSLLAQNLCTNFTCVCIFGIRHRFLFHLHSSVDIHLKVSHLFIRVGGKTSSTGINFILCLQQKSVVTSADLSELGSFRPRLCRMASTTVTKESGPAQNVEGIKSAEQQKLEADNEATRFPKDVDGATHGKVWQDIAVPMKKDPANKPGSEEWDQTKHAFAETGLLKRM